MRFADTTRFCLARACAATRSRTLLILLAMGIGVAAVVAVSVARRGRAAVCGEPVRVAGAEPGDRPARAAARPRARCPACCWASTPRDLTLDDALALKRSPAVRRLAPLIVGAGDVRVGALSRETPVLGAGHELLEMRNDGARAGPVPARHRSARQRPGVRASAPRSPRSCFRRRTPLGEWLRIGDRRFRVIGVLAAQGESLGFNTDEVVIVPVAAAQALFNTEALFRILVEAKSREQHRRGQDGHRAKSCASATRASAT